MKNVHVSYDENVLVGFDKSDDAGVYRISGDIALVQTLDFFTPIVDDPFTFGQIAAANALSDVYAMGGVPVTAMNIVAFPLKKFSLDVLTAILNGGLHILNQAGVQLLGGHSIEDNELKYGLSITGRIHPDKILKNHGLENGDAIILTKPLGTGIIGTAVKADMAAPEIMKPFIASMITLNRGAAEAMSTYPVRACTDVTGFGLVGHMKEMLTGDMLEIEINSSSLPVLPGVRDNSEMGLVPAGLYRNKSYSETLCHISRDVPLHLSDVLFDPQTSGGLLIALPGTDAPALLKEMHDRGISDARIIASVKKSPEQKIRII